MLSFIKYVFVEVGRYFEMLNKSECESYFVLFVELYVSINEITAFFFALYSLTVILPSFALNKIFAGLYI